MTRRLYLSAILADGFHVGALPVEMHRDQRLGPLRDRLLDPGRINAVGVLLRIDEDGGGVGDPDRLGGGEKGVGGRDALIAPPDAERQKGEPQRIGAVADSDGVFHAVIAGQLPLEALEHRPHDVLAAFEHLADVGVDLGLDVVILPDMTVKGYVHRSTKLPKRNG